jgi:hypothetical protein
MPGWEFLQTFLFNPTNFTALLHDSFSLSGWLLQIRHFYASLKGKMRHYFRAQRRNRRRGRHFLGLLAAWLALAGFRKLATQTAPPAQLPFKLLLLVIGGVVLGSLSLVTLLILTLTGAWQQMGNFMLGLGLWAAIVGALVLAFLWARRSSSSGQDWLAGLGGGLGARLAATRTRLTTPREPQRNAAYYRKRADAYRRRMQRLVKARPKGPLTDTLAAVLPKVARWQERVEQLAGRLQTFEGDSLIQRDVKEVPQAIARLERQIPLEADPQLRQQMAATLTGYRGQQALLADLARAMRRTRLQLDDTLASMGTIYSQFQMIDAVDVDGPEAKRIAGEIDEQVRRLNDLLAAIPEAYAGADPLGAAGIASAAGHLNATPTPVPTSSDPAEVAARRARLEQTGATGKPGR